MKLMPVMPWKHKPRDREGLFLFFFFSFFVWRYAGVGYFLLVWNDRTYGLEGWGGNHLRVLHYLTLHALYVPY